MRHHDAIHESYRFERRLSVKTIKMPILVLLAALAVPVFVVGGEKSASTDTGGPAVKVQGNYASVNGLKMYYEIHGTGRPLVLLHGAFGWATVFPTLAKARQVIAVELQGTDTRLTLIAR
jgi:hypothetical protein